MPYNQLKELNSYDLLKSITLSLGHKLDVDQILVYEIENIYNDKTRKFLSWNRSGEFVFYNEKLFDINNEFLNQLVDKISVNLTSWGNADNINGAEFFNSINARSYLASAIFSEGSLWGFVLCLDVRERQWVPSDLSVLSDAAVEYAKYIHYSQYLNDLVKTSSDLRFIIDDVSDLIIWLDTDARITNIDGRLSAISGYSKNDLIGRSISEFILDEDNEKYSSKEEAIKAFLMSRNTSEKRIVMKNGLNRWVIIKSHPLVTNGVQTGSVCLVTDIEELKQRLSSSGNQDQDNEDVLSGYLKEVLFVADMNLNLKYISASDERERGFSEKESLRQTLRDVFPSDDLRKILTILPKTAFPEVCVLETQIIRKDGIKFNAEIVVTSEFNEHGIPVSIKGLYRNIERQKFYENRFKEYENKYRILTNGQKDAILVFDNELKFEYFSPSLSAISGYSEAELMKILKDKPADLIGKDNYQAFYKSLSLRMSYYLAGKEFFSDKPIECFIIKRDASRIPVEITTTGIFDNTKSCSGIACNIREIFWKKNLSILKDEFSRQYNNHVINEVGQFYIDKNYIINEADIEAIKILGIQSSDIRYISMSGILTTKSFGKFEREISKIESLKESSKIIEFQPRYSHERRSYFAIKIDFAGYDLNGDNIYRCSIADISDTVSSQLTANHIKALMENTNDLVWFTDTSLRFTYIGSSIEQLLGFSRESAMNLTGEFLFSKDTLHELSILFTKGIAAGKRKLPFSVQIPVEMKNINGSIVGGNLKLALIYNNHSVPIGFIGLTSFGSSIPTAVGKNKIVRIR